MSERCSRANEAGYKGFELFASEGAALSFVERYAGEIGVADTIFADASQYAKGFGLGSRFFLKACNDGTGPSPSASPSFAFYIPAAPPLHEPERHDAHNLTRLLIEFVDRQNRVITQVVPACMGAMGGMVQGLATHFGTLAETQDAAIRTLREHKLATIEAERMMLADATRAARLDKLVDVGLAMLPQVLEAATKKQDT